MSQRRWTHQTAEKVANSLVNSGITVSDTVVRRLLAALDYSLKSNKKRLSSGNSPHRDKQFGIIKGLREELSKTGDPIISVDTKKKELKATQQQARRSSSSSKSYEHATSGDERTTSAAHPSPRRFITRELTRR